MTSSRVVSFTSPITEDIPRLCGVTRTVRSEHSSFGSRTPCAGCFDCTRFAISGVTFRARQPPWVMNAGPDDGVAGGVVVDR